MKTPLSDYCADIIHDTSLVRSLLPPYEQTLRFLVTCQTRDVVVLLFPSKSITIEDSIKSSAVMIAVDSPLAYSLFRPTFLITLLQLISDWLTDMDPFPQAAAQEQRNQSR